MASIRTWHSYIGILIAPSVLFFCLTGALQIFNLHEAHGTYRPPPLIEKLSSLHKDQVLARKQHDEAGADAQQPAQDSHDDEPGSRIATVVLKGFFLLVALSLCVSTALGLSIGLTHIRRRRTAWSLLVVGIVLPLVLSLL